MKKNVSVMQWAVLLVSCLGFASCEAIGGIFKAGVWSGVILVVVIVALVIFIIAKMSGSGKS